MINIYEHAVKELPKEHIDHYCSDLYLKKTSKSDALVNDYEYKNNVAVFKDQIDHELWYEIPFGYTPFYGGSDLI